jgi:hypothetical protein
MVLRREAGIAFWGIEGGNLDLLARKLRGLLTTFQRSCIIGNKGTCLVRRSISSRTCFRLE